MILFANCNVGIIRVYRTTELEENLSRFAEISPFCDGTTGSFSQKLYTLYGILRISYGFFGILHLLSFKKGPGQILFCLVRNIYQKFWEAEYWLKMTRTADFCPFSW